MGDRDRTARLPDARGDILVVEHDAAIGEFIADLLSDEGYSVRRARTNDQAHAAIDAQPPGLLLYDLHVPGESGLNLIAVVHMKAHLSRVHWALVVKTAILVYIVTFILGVALSFPVLAFLNWAHLSSQSAFQVSSVISALVVFVVTGYGALWVARRVESAALVHGLLVGLLVALISLVLDVLFIPAIELLGMGMYILMVAAGLLGGVLGSRRRQQS